MSEAKIHMMDVAKRLPPKRWGKRFSAAVVVFVALFIWILTLTLGNKPTTQGTERTTPEPQTQTTERTTTPANKDCDVFCAVEKTHALLEKMGAIGKSPISETQVRCAMDVGAALKLMGMGSLFPNIIHDAAKGNVDQQNMIALEAVGQTFDECVNQRH